MALFWILVLATLLVAVADWWAVAAGRKPVEYVFKPLTMAVLIGAALAMPDPVSSTSRTWFVVALALSLVGDVFLMLPESELKFIGGLGSFLLGHVAYILGILAIDDFATGRLVVGVVLVLVGIATLGQTIVRGAYRTDKVFGVPVALYIGVISTMVALAVGTGRPVLILGAVLFFISDACIGWSKFVKEFPGYRMAIITTYHLGQVGLLLGLLTHWS